MIVMDKPAKLFDQLHWQQDRMVLNDLVFRLEHHRDDATWDRGEDCFHFFKIKKLMDQYDRFFSLRPNFRPAAILELGIFDGGSAALWFELFQPRKLVGIDFQHRSNSPYFDRYCESRGLQDRLRTYWKTNQADSAALQRILVEEFPEPLDLVMDDASHLYEPTKASFELLFPRLRPGGFYIIEDWAWAHWPGYQEQDHEWAFRKPVTQLLVELIEAVGTSTRLISRVNVFEGFIAVERGEWPAEEIAEFHLEDHILRRPQDDYRWLSSNHRQFQTNHRILQEKHEQLGESFAEVNAYRELLEYQRDELQRNLDDLQARFSELQTSHGSLQERHAGQQEEFGIQQERLLLLQQEHAVLQERFAHQQQRLTYLRDSHGLLQKRFSNLEGEHGDLQERFGQLQLEQDGLQARNAQQRLNYEELQKRHLPLTTFSGLLGRTLKSGLHKVRSLFGSG